MHTEILFMSVQQNEYAIGRVCRYALAGRGLGAYLHTSEKCALVAKVNTDIKYAERKV